MTDVREWHRRATATTKAIVAQVAPDQLHRDTPCAEWTLGELLAHMIGQNYGFAAAASGDKTELDIWADRPVGVSPGGSFAASADAVTAAFAVDGVLDRGFWLPELNQNRPFPAEQAMGFHFLDTMVHGWDVATALGVPIEFDPDLVQALLPIAQAVPGGTYRLSESSMFGPEIEIGQSRALFDQILAMLGREV